MVSIRDLSHCRCVLQDGFARDMMSCQGWSLTTGCARVRIKKTLLLGVINKMPVVDPSFSLA